MGPRRSKEEFPQKRTTTHSVEQQQCPPPSSPVADSVSSEDEESENATRAPTELPEVITAPECPGTSRKGLQLLNRMCEVPQEVSRQGTSVEMTVEDSDNHDEEWDPDRVFDLVES